ncbi:MAG: haloacid dehalogenase [Thermotogae bacterium]|nr:HAD family phosphatase [Thermotogota bacterium]RKX44797.1 MAG: haloacid dehalogenase [Thermotogota bacterium]
MKKCVIFDMDGVLVDSESVYFEAISEVIESFGHKLGRELFKRTMGIPMERGGARVLIEELGMDIGEEELLKNLDVSYAKHFSRPLKPRPGILELIRELKSHGFTLCVATSTRRAMAEDRLRSSSLLDYMDYVVCGDEIERGKPDPEIFLEALARSSCRAEETVVFEDSPNGVRAAVNAGIEVYGILHDFNDPEELLNLGAIKVFRLPDDVTHIERLLMNISKQVC